MDRLTLISQAHRIQRRQLDSHRPEHRRDENLGAHDSKGQQAMAGSLTLILQARGIQASQVDIHFSFQP